MDKLAPTLEKAPGGDRDSDGDFQEEQDSDDGDFVSPRGSTRRSRRAPATPPAPPTAAMLVGPPGSGKTAAIAACAAELGYQLIELHAGQQRTGKLLLGTLHEATQSHNVSATATRFDDPASASGALFASLPPRRRPDQFADGVIYTTTEDETPLEAAEALECNVADLVKQNVDRYPGLKPKSLLKAGTQLVYTPLVAAPAPPDDIPASGDVGEEVADPSAGAHSAAGAGGGIGLDASLIVIEDVDLAFESDHGYWRAIDSLITTTKKPIVFTTSCLPADRPVFRSPCRVLPFRPPTSATLLRHVRLVCLAEGLSVCSADLAKLIAFKNRDIRATLCALQSWSSHADAAERAPRFQDIAQDVAQPGGSILPTAVSRCGIDTEDPSEAPEKVARCVVELDGLAAMLDTLSFTDWGPLGPSDAVLDTSSSARLALSEQSREMGEAAATVCEACIGSTADQREVSIAEMLECMTETAEMEAEFWKERDSLGGQAEGGGAAAELCAPAASAECAADAMQLDGLPGSASVIGHLGALCQAHTLRTVEPVDIGTVAKHNFAALSKALGPAVTGSRDAVALDVLPTIRQILASEEGRRVDARRFYHYLSSLDIAERHFKLLADGFNSESRPNTSLSRAWSIAGLGTARFPCTCRVCTDNKR